METRSAKPQQASVDSSLVLSDQFATRRLVQPMLRRNSRENSRVNLTLKTGCQIVSQEVSDSEVESRGQPDLNQGLC